MQGWTKIKPGASYAGVSERTFRGWPELGLSYVRLPSGSLLTKYEWIDHFLKQYEASQQKDRIDRIVDEVTSSISD